MFSSLLLIARLLSQSSSSPLFAQTAGSPLSPLPLQICSGATSPENCTANTFSLQGFIPIRVLEVDLGMAYSRYQGSLPTRKDQFRVHNKEQEAIQASVGLEAGPFLFHKTRTVAAYQYAQEWYTDNSSLTDFIRKPFSASGRLLKNADLLEREHRVYLNSKTYLLPNLEFLLWLSESVKFAGSRYLLQENQGLHEAKSYLLKKWTQVKPTLLWNIDQTHQLNFFLDFYKEYSALQPEQSYQSYYFKWKAPKLSLGLLYKYKLAPSKLVGLEISKEHHRLGDPLEDFERTGITTSYSHKVNEKYSLDASFGILYDKYKHPSLFSLGPESPVYKRSRKESMNFVSLDQNFRLNINHKFRFSLYYSHNENKESRPKTLTHIIAQIKWSYLLPFTETAGLKSLKEGKHLTSKRIEYHGIR